MNYFTSAAVSSEWERSVEEKRSISIVSSPVLAALLGTFECTLNRPWHDLTACHLTSANCNGRSPSVGSSQKPSPAGATLVLLLEERGWPWRKAYSFDLRYRGRDRRSGRPCLSMPPVPNVACSGTSAGERSGSSSWLRAGLRTCWGGGSPFSRLEAGCLRILSNMHPSVQEPQSFTTPWELIYFQDKVFK